MNDSTKELAAMLTEQEKKFADILLICGKPKEAAVKAGYSEGTARYASQWLNPNSPKNKKFKKNLYNYLKAVAEEATSETILSTYKRREILSRIAMNEDNLPSDRIRAIDILNRMDDIYNEKQNEFRQRELELKEKALELKQADADW